MNRGYVKLWRKSVDAGWIKNHKLWAFWTYCLMKASHKPFKAIVGNQEVFLAAGQFVTGLRVISKETGLTIRETRTVLAFLVNAGNLTIKTTNKFSIITIVNWNTYQGGETENDTVNDKRKTNDRQHTRTIEHKKKDPSEISSSISALKERYPDQTTIDQTLEAIATTRKTGRLADTVTLAILKAWGRYTVDQVMTGARTYLERDYAGQGRNERYLLGIIRNSDGTATESQTATKSTGSRLLDDYYRSQGETIT
jgi:hypothetical protein